METFQVGRIPGVRREPFWLWERPMVVVKGAPPVVAAVVAACKAYGDPASGSWVFGLSVGIAIWLILAGVLSFAQAAHRDGKREHAQSPQDLRGCLHVIYESVAAAYRTPVEGGALPPERFRVTIHRQVNTDWLEQVVDYVGGIPAENGEAGRRFKRQSGIIGRAAMAKKPFVAKRNADNQEAFQAEMVERWHIDPAEASNLKTDRWSWMAVPITSPDGEVLAVVFADSPEKGFFSEAIQERIISGVQGLSRFVDERYRDH